MALKQETIRRLSKQRLISIQANYLSTRKDSNRFRKSFTPIIRIKKVLIEIHLTRAPKSGLEKAKSDKKTTTTRIVNGAEAKVGLEAAGVARERARKGSPQLR